MTIRFSCGRQAPYYVSDFICERHRVHSDGAELHQRVVPSWPFFGPRRANHHQLQEEETFRRDRYFGECAGLAVLILVRVSDYVNIRALW